MTTSTIGTFFRTFKSEKHGDILVLMETNEDDFSPELRVYTDVQGEWAGICHLSLKYSDDDKGVAARKQALKDITLEQVEHCCDQITDMTKDL